MWVVRQMKLESGERICLPFQDRVPVFYPTYYVTRNLRSMSPSTQKNQLQELRILSSWEADSKISVIDRFTQGDSLSDIEVQNLVDFCGYSADTIRKIEAGVKILESGYKYVRTNVKRFRLQTIRNYLEFLCKLVSTHPDKAAQAEQMAKTIKSFTPRSRGDLCMPDEKSLNEEQIDVLTVKLMPGHPENPFSDEALQFRNLIMIHVLYETGIRQGELLGLYVEDVDFEARNLRIRRRHHDPRDPRTPQPLQKTRERDIAIPDGLLDMLRYYILEFRGRSKAARKHPVLFVGHRNKSEGQPLSAPGLRYVFRSLKKAFSVMKGVHSHLVRHHFNYRFSIMLENIEGWEYMTPEERMNIDASTRSDIMGWSPEGTQQKRYNRRYDMEVTNKALKQRNDPLKGIILDKDAE